MEQRGRNRWQTFGCPAARKRLDLGRNRCHWLPSVAVGIAWVGGGRRPTRLVGARLFLVAIRARAL